MSINTSERLAFSLTDSPGDVRAAARLGNIQRRHDTHRMGDY